MSFKFKSTMISINVPIPFEKESILVACVDVGGTNCRVSVAETTNPTILHALIAFPCSSADVLADTLGKVGEQMVEAGIVVSATGIDVAGPVSFDRTSSKITNYAPKTDIRLADLPKTLFLEGRTVLLNDLEATCHGLLGLAKENALHDHFSPLFDDARVSIVPGKHYVVAAVGTGLGIGLLLSSEGTEHSVLPCEHGHATIAPLGPAHPGYAEEQALFAFASQELYGGSHAPEYEDFVSGRGLTLLYRFLEGQGDANPAAVATAALAGEEKAVRALTLHYEYLMRNCQQLAISVQAKGVLLCGDNQARNHDFVDARKEALRAVFVNHQKDSWLGDIRVACQTKPLNANLIGCAKVAIDQDLQ